MQQVGYYKFNSNKGNNKNKEINKNVKDFISINNDFSKALRAQIGKPKDLWD